MAGPHGGLQPDGHFLGADHLNSRFTVSSCAGYPGTMHRPPGLANPENRIHLDVSMRYTHTPKAGSRVPVGNSYLVVTGILMRLSSSKEFRPVSHACCYPGTRYLDTPGYPNGRKGGGSRGPGRGTGTLGYVPGGQTFPTYPGTNFSGGQRAIKTKKSWHGIVRP
eukprot:3535089-Rhodomonas_salina.1